MDFLIGGLIFAGLFAVYDALRKVNNNILIQTEEIKKIREEINNQKRQ